MPKIAINPTEAQEFEPIENGVYVAKVHTTETEIKRGPKAEYVPVSFIIAEGRYRGRRLTRNYPISGPGVAFLLQLLRAIGLYGGGDKPFTLDTKAMHGKTCKIRVFQRDYEGRVVNDVRDVMAASVPDRDPDADVADEDVEAVEEDVPEEKPEEKPKRGRRKIPF